MLLEKAKGFHVAWRERCPPSSGLPRQLPAADLRLQNPIAIRAVSAGLGSAESH